MFCSKVVGIRLGNLLSHKTRVVKSSKMKDDKNIRILFSHGYFGSTIT